MDRTFRLFDFNIYNKKNTEDGSDNSSNDGEQPVYKDTAEFLVQMFGINEKGESCSIIVENFKPFFYVKVGDDWTIHTKNLFLAHIKKRIGKYYENSINECKIIKRKKLYGFDGGKEYKFIWFTFNNIQTFNKVKNLWYEPFAANINGKMQDRKLLVGGYLWQGLSTELYEANIPPLLRFFHVKDISPSGWVALPNNKTVVHRSFDKKTTCMHEFTINCKHIIPLNSNEKRVPYKICSFDIEASSSHGDFPVPIKSYKKLATNIMEYIESHLSKTNQGTSTVLDVVTCADILKKCILAAFGYDTMIEVDLVYPKRIPKSRDHVIKMIDRSLNELIGSMDLPLKYRNKMDVVAVVDEEEEEDEEKDIGLNKYYHFGGKYGLGNTPAIKSKTIVDILCNTKVDREIKLDKLNLFFVYEYIESIDNDGNKNINSAKNSLFPELEGDKVTFIGSTFMTFGQPDPYLSNCIVLNTCAPMMVEKSQLETYSSEREVLIAWKNLIQREDPDIIIGYNIFGFDYQFMFYRSEENDCTEEFLKLSKNKDEICGTIDPKTKRYKIEESKIVVASGEHDLKYIKMTGRVQIDLYNFFRKEENLVSYKLDSVAGHFIGDFVKKIEYIEDVGDGNPGNYSLIQTTNMTGLLPGSYIHIEEIGHTTDYYSDGDKFIVTSVDKTAKTFTIQSKICPDMSKKVRWCLAKDDVTPKDLFRMTNGTDEDRAVIAKYCIQDCNLVHYLLNKVDVLTGFIEMSKLCSVPISFLVLRGQGIKLTSYVAKKCREKRTLMPCIEKLDSDDGYEGAIVLEPKCDLYLDNPVACVDYASLYPSSMMSENISHDSKVWTKEYDLVGELVPDGERGEKNESGEFIYDNLPGYEYVDITYDTFKYVRKTPSAAAEKIKCGYKICRFVQYPIGSRAIMPSILEELLVARKTTRKRIPLETDEFMKNVLDKRQLAYKLTANSLYGQCGARTSTFYEKDIAAATTATGRLLLTYAKKLIEETYGNKICDTVKYGKVVTKAEYIYGDTDSVFFTFNLQTLTGENIRGKKALEITIELAQQAGHLASSFLKAPHDLEYEKTFMPFCLLSKKRYVGMLYETDANKGKRKEMGIVLKRRDNAPIVKDIYGGIIDILMKQQNIQQAADFLKACLKDIVDEKCPIEKLIISKSLRSGYKNPKQIAHKVLADRIMSRDPGNKPTSGDRIPFAYINNPNKKALQGDKIETPTYIKENKLKIDYSFYITNQIMKPVQQIFALVLEKMWVIKNKKAKISKFQIEVQQLRKTHSPDKVEDKIDDLKNKEVKMLLFDEFLRETNNSKAGNQSIISFCKK